jgi:hypothetical protein
MDVGLTILGSTLLQGLFGSKASDSQASALAGASAEQIAATKEMQQEQLKFEREGLAWMKQTQEESIGMLMDSYVNDLRLGTEAFVTGERARASMEALTYGRPAQYISNIVLNVQKKQTGTTATSGTTATQGTTTNHEIAPTQGTTATADPGMATLDAIVQKAKLQETISTLKSLSENQNVMIQDDGKGNMVVYGVTDKKTGISSGYKIKGAELAKIPLADIPGADSIKRHSGGGAIPMSGGVSQIHAEGGGAVLEGENFLNITDLVSSLENSSKTLGEQIRTGQTTSTPTTPTGSSTTTATPTGSSADPTSGAVAGQDVKERPLVEGYEAGGYSDMPDVDVERSIVDPETLTQGIYDSPAAKYRTQQRERQVKNYLGGDISSSAALKTMMRETEAANIAEEDRTWNKLATLAGYGGAASVSGSGTASQAAASTQSGGQAVSQTIIAGANTRASMGQNALQNLYTSNVGIGKATSNFWSGLGSSIGVGIEDYLGYAEG